MTMSRQQSLGIGLRSRARCSCLMKLPGEASETSSAGTGEEDEFAGSIAVPYAAWGCESGFRDGALMRPATNY